MKIFHKGQIQMMKASKTGRVISQKKRKTDDKKNKELFAEAHTVAPAPSRDYYALHLYQKKFLWTQWKISHGPFMNPVQKVVTMDEFIRDNTMQNELTYIFGADITNLIRDLAHQKWTLISMPSNVLQKIFSYISVQDILRLSQVCKRLSKECSKNELWKTICKKQWKILIHNDIEKASLIGWKNVYLEKMRPKRYKTEHYPRPNIFQRNRIGSISALNTPDSRASTVKTNLPTKRFQDLKKADSLRTASEVFGKEFKVISTSTGKSVERPVPLKNTRTSESRPFSSGRMNLTSRSTFERKYFQQPTNSILNLVQFGEKSLKKEPLRKNKSPRMIKCKVTSIRTCPGSPQSTAPTEIESGRLKDILSRTRSGKAVKLGNKL